MSTSSSWTSALTAGGRSTGRLLEVGRIVKPHGLSGEVVVVLITDRTERLAPGTTLDSTAGPLTVEASRPHQQRFLVHFVGVRSREEAEALRATVLRAPPIEDPDALWAHDVIGRDVVLADGSPCGTVTAVEANPADDLLVLGTGALVPARFVRGWDDEHRLVLDPPDGLLDL